MISFFAEELKVNRKLHKDLNALQGLLVPIARRFNTAILCSSLKTNSKV